MSAQALSVRNTAAGTLSATVRSVKRYKDIDNPSMRLLKNKLEKLVEDREDLMYKHCLYAEKANKDQSEELQEFINIRMDEANDLADEIYLLLDSDVNNAKHIEMKVAERQCQSDEATLRERIQAMNVIVEDATKTTKEDGMLVRTHLKQVDESLGDLIKSWNVIKFLPITADKLESVFASEEAAKKYVSENRLLASAFIENTDPDSIIKSSDTSVFSDNDTSYDSRHLKLEKMKNPTFDGDIRSYARFKSDFQDIVAPSYPDKKHQLYVLKESCLRGNARKLVANMVDTEEIWARLEARYGNDIEIVNAVIKSIQNFQFTKEHDKCIVSLVDELEKGVEDLKAIDAMHNIANAFTVKLLEEKLPRHILKRWFEKEEALQKTNDRFDAMMSFLKLERKQAERILLVQDQKPPKDPPAKDNREKKGSNFSGGVDGNKRNQNPKNNCLLHPNNYHLTRHCHDFRAMSVDERGKILKDTKGCKLCLSSSHIGKPCPFEDKWTNKCGVDGCKESHSKMIHGCKVQGILCFTWSCNTQQENYSTGGTLLLIEKVKTKRSFIVTFWDNGSTIALVSKDYCIRNNLQGLPVSYDLITVGNNINTYDTMLYEIILVDRLGNEHVIKAYEIDDICGEMNSMKTSKFSHLFSSVTARDIARPKGKIDLLVGIEYSEIHPDKTESREGLSLYKTKFGTGKILGGRHKNVQGSMTINPIARQCAQAAVVNVRIRRNSPEIDFITSEGFGVQIPRRCKNCEGCKICKFEVHQLSRIEQKELEVIRQNLVLDPVKEVWTTSYPYARDPSVLQNNEAQAESLAKGTEKRLMKNKFMAEKYNEQFRDLIARDVFVEITEEEDKEYTGPVFYVNPHEVFKPGSTSTPVRIVVNSSLKYRGLSLNDILMKGPNSLNDLFGIQLRFRKYPHVLVGDMKKMYHTVRTTVLEKHLRRVKWRFLDTLEPFKTYGINRVMFGDTPAACITTVAIRETANTFKHIDKVAAEKIVNDSYVDDIITGADTREEVECLKENIPKIVSKGGFEMKGQVTNGDNSEKSLSILGTGDIGRVLGVCWDPASDELVISVKINVSPKCRGARTAEDYTYEQIPQLLEVKLTRRIILGVANSCYDVYGLVSAITIQVKIELRNLYGKEANLGWDDTLPRDVKLRWVKILQLLKSAEKIRFRRCVKPAAAVGQPILIVCNDGSEEAMCATAHIRWELQDGSYECCLYVAKTRVTPLRKETIPRIEIQSAVLATRLSKTILTHSEMEFSEVVHILDSMCSLATLKKDTVALREYMGNRVSEILSSTSIEQWYHVKSKENIADLGTRSTACVEDLDERSEWQLGKGWMKLPRERWPLTQDSTGATVSAEELSNPAIVAFLRKTDNSYNIERFKGRSYMFMLRVTARVLKSVRYHSFRITELVPIDIEEAEKLCLKSSMMHTKQAFTEGKLKSLGAQINDDGIIHINSRADTEMSAFYDNDIFPILLYNDPLSYIWMQYVHNEDHTGVVKTLFKSRRKFWIVRGRRLSEKIKRSCYRCRLTDKKLAEQKMSPLPDTRLKIAPVFYTVSMDLFGPIMIKDTVKQRTKKKVWGVIFSCTVVRALYLDLTEDYGTDSILQTIRRFISIRGCPSEIQSDEGSQLIAASKEIAQLVGDWDWKPVHEWTTAKMIKWKLAPAEGQHQNGLSESLIKSVKHSLKHKITGGNVLTFSELQMVLFEIANIINSRPIGVLSESDSEQPCPITTNHLLLGRATADVPQGPFDASGSKKVTRHFRYLQTLVTEWWEHWYQTVLPSLVPNYKWLQRHRNVMIGDVCLIRYRNDVRATYRLGRVADVKKGSDGLVRTVVLKYKLPSEKTFRFVNRPIHGISVIVPIEEQLNADTRNSLLHSKLNPEASEYAPK